MRISSIPQWRYVVHVLGMHARRRWWLYGIAAAAFAWCDTHYRVALNMSNSMPQSMYLVVLGSQPTGVGDFVAFEWQRDQFYRRDWTFIKRVAGVPGQAVTVSGRNVYIDGKSVGHAKTVSSHGVPLDPIPPGVIPPGYIYATATHPDSLDSRYSVTGLIQSSRIIGKAYAIF
ncbi:S26 family signal peptidase [Janthinobacterium sp. J1-1]|uniref:S26 family signal peptidase n=1 Tax=Janthinobacterium sp. J1-1 TaxID=3065910 RepID=UPI002810E4F3|nr:S26 family signal peptidase [Janthinobacterium sp. J1-1]